MSSLTLAQSKDFLKELSSPAKVPAKATREAKVSVGDLWDTRGFLEKLDALGFLSTSVEDILGHEDLVGFFNSQKSQKKSQKKCQEIWISSAVLKLRTKISPVVSMLGRRNSYE